MSWLSKRKNRKLNPQGGLRENPEDSLEPRPNDYEECDTCGWDHAYDFDYLSKEELAEAKQDHIDGGDSA